MQNVAKAHDELINEIRSEYKTIERIKDNIDEVLDKILRNELLRYFGDTCDWVGNTSSDVKSSVLYLLGFLLDRDMDETKALMGFIDVLSYIETIILRCPETPESKALALCIVNSGLPFKSSPTYKLSKDHSRCTSIVSKVPEAKLTMLQNPTGYLDSIDGLINTLSILSKKPLRQYLLDSLSLSRDSNDYDEEIPLSTADRLCKYLGPTLVKYDANPNYVQLLKDFIRVISESNDINQSLSDLLEGYMDALIVTAFTVKDISDIKSELYNVESDIILEVYSLYSETNFTEVLQSESADVYMSNLAHDILKFISYDVNMSICEAIFESKMDDMSHQLATKIFMSKLSEDDVKIEGVE